MPRHPAVFLVAFVVPVTVVMGVWIGGMGTFLTPVVLLGLVPLADLALGRDRSNPTPGDLEGLRERRAFRWITWLWMPTQGLLLLWGTRVAGSGALSGVEVAGLVVSLGLTTGAIGITVAHELIHRESAWEKGLGLALLGSVGYMHFFIEHIQGHHKNVATERDPATARRGESVYAFVGRSLVGGWTSAWRLEAQRLDSRGLRVVSWRNRMLWFACVPVGLSAGLGAWWGGMAAAVFWFQSAIAVVLLEIVNYIEHYGLARQPGSRAGTHEPVGPAHSWNADFRLTNAFLFGLQRHTDHHLHPRRRYQTLRSFEESPELPLGYAGMVWIAAVPPLWRRIMDARLPRSAQVPGS